MKKLIFISLLTGILAAALLNSCKPLLSIKLDFNPVKDKNKLDTAKEIITGKWTRNGVTFKGFQIPCNGGASVFKIKNLSGDIGILNINSLFDSTDCDLTVKVTGLCTTCDAGIAPKKLKPGESVTDIFDLAGHTDDLTITITCNGDNSTKCIFNIDFSTAVKLDPAKTPPPKPALVKPIASNPEGNTAFEPVNKFGNQCTTKPLLLKTIYLDLDQGKKGTPLSFSFVSKPLCDCIPFNVTVSSDAAGAKPIAAATGNTNGAKGAEIKIPEKISTGLSALYFWGECAGGKNPPCRGDVAVNITGGGK
jgi:hypothetical protein